MPDTHSKKNAKSQNPDFLTVMTSGACGNQCLFCVERRPEDGKFNVLENYLRLYGSAYLDSRTYVRLLAETKERRPVLFVGGEPTRHPQMAGFIRAARQWGAPEIRMITNGRPLKDRSLCRKLIGSGLTEIAFSIHGSSAEVHDAVTRGPGSFVECVQGLKNVLSLQKEYPIKVRINCTLSRLNYGGVDDHLRWFSSFKGIHLIVLAMVQIQGLAEREFEKLLLPLSEAAPLVRNALRSQKRRKGPKVLVSGLPPCLMKGFTKSIHVHNSIRILDGDDRPRSPREDRVKGPDCERCRYFRTCEGVDSGYVTRRGFSEFIPVLSRKSLKNKG